MTPADETFMRAALREAEAAGAAGEVPIGAVAVKRGRIIASARNRVEEKHSAACHAEFELLHAVEAEIGDWRMEEIDFYVTKEPCPMCSGMLVNARVRRVVFGVADPRAGGCGGALDIPGHSGMLWRVETMGGVLAAECEALLKEFCRKQRSLKRTPPGEAAVRNFYEPAYAANHRDIMREVFGGDLDFWFRAGRWDRDYESCAIREPSGRIIAHAGASLLTLRIGEAAIPAVEWNGVATRPEARGRGLARKLLEFLLARHPERPAFLFANPAALDFYPRFGFRPVEDRLPVIDALLPGTSRKPVRIPPAKAQKLYEENRFRYRGVDAEGALSLRLFHLLGDWQKKLFLLRDGLAIAAEVHGEILRIHDLFGPLPPATWGELQALLPFPGIRRIEFGFDPPFADASAEMALRKESRHLLLYGELPLPELFTFPESLET